MMYGPQFFAQHYTVRLFVTSILLTLSSANFAFDNQGFSQVSGGRGVTLARDN